jgi:hypothetical protein
LEYECSSYQKEKDWLLGFLEKFPNLVELKFGDVVKDLTRKYYVLGLLIFLVLTESLTALCENLKTIIVYILDERKVFSGYMNLKGESISKKLKLLDISNNKKLIYIKAPLDNSHKPEIFTHVDPSLIDEYKNDRALFYFNLKILLEISNFFKD